MSHRQAYRERGAAAVEMALVLPILLLLVGGIIDFGRFFFTQVQITNAAREGARAAIIPGATMINIINRTNTAGVTAPGWVTPTAADFVFTTSSGVVVASCATSGASQVTATTNASFHYFFVNILPGVANPATLRATATMGCG